MTSNSITLSQNQFNQLITQNGYGVSTFFTKSIPVLYSDNSMQKYSEQTTRRSAQRNRMIQHMTMLKAKQERKKARNQRIKLNQTIETQLTSEIIDRLDKLHQMESAAIIIQKFARGYLIRKKTENLSLEYKRRAIQSLIAEIQDTSYNCFFSVGKVRVLAAIRIQKAYRRIQLRRKIEKLIHNYKLYCQTQKANAQELLSRVLPMMYCKRVCKDIQFQKMKVIRLEIIKRNLAILIIKKAWNNLSLTSKTLRRKLSTFKRKYEARLKKEAYLRRFAKLENKSTEEPRLTRNTNTISRSSLDMNTLLDSKGENYTTKSHDEEDNTAMLEAMNAIYMSRLNQSKTSYGVRVLKMRKITPILTRGISGINDDSALSTPNPPNLLNIQQKCNQKVSVFFPYDNNKSFRDNSVEESSTRVNTIRETSRNHQNSSRRSASYCIEDCNYMKTTASSIAKIEQFVEECSEKTHKIARTSPRVLNPTISYKSKTRPPVSYPRAERQLFMISATNKVEFSPLPEISLIKEQTKLFYRSRLRTASNLEPKPIYSRPTSSSVSYEINFRSFTNLNTPKSNQILASLPKNENLFTKCFPIRMLVHNSNTRLNSSGRTRTLH